MDRQIRLCIVSPLFHPNIGGPGRQAYTMASELNNRGITLMVITRKLDIEIPDLDVKIHRVRTPMPQRYTLSEFTFLNFLISAFFSLGMMVRLFQWRKRFDIVQFYGASLPLLISLPLLKILKKKIVAKLSGAKPGMEAGSFEGFILKPFLSRVFSLVDNFIIMSDELKHRLLVENYPETKVVKIPNGVDIKLFSPFDTEKREKLRKDFEISDKKVFVYAGRLVDGKGLDLLLEAVKLIMDKDKTVYLLLLGEGPIKTRLEDKASSLGISDNVYFRGNVDNVYEYLNMSDIFVFPSFSEGMPNSLLEAMACGLPVIASRIGGVVDVVEDGKSGILFEPGDVSGLASAMVRLLRDEELRQRLGTEARKRIVDNFSIDRVADEYIKLYKKLIVHGS